jgi:SAM-dependent methyltransferase
MTLLPDAPEVVYAKMRCNAPLSETHASLLLRRFDVGAGDQVLDLGCGWGDLLLRALAVGDRVICVGASHALGGTAVALHHLGAIVRPGGRLLFGDGCWENPPPNEAAHAIFGDDILALGDLTGEAVEAGWRIIHLSTADQREWDDFESTWRAGRQEWLLSNPGNPRAGEVQNLVDRQQRDYIDGYRGVLGFAYLVLAR